MAAEGLRIGGKIWGIMDIQSAARANPAEIHASIRMRNVTLDLEGHRVAIPIRAIADVLNLKSSVVAVTLLHRIVSTIPAVLVVTIQIALVTDDRDKNKNGDEMVNGKNRIMTMEEYISLGRKNEWSLLPARSCRKKEGIRLTRIGQNEIPETITFWPSTGKVGTVLQHPKKGKTQQFSNPSFQQLSLMLSQKTGPGRGLRTHTNSGYRRKKK